MKKRNVTINKLADRKKPWRITYWESDKRCRKHFAKKVDAELFAKQQGWEALDAGLAVSAEERVALSRARGAAAVLGVDTNAVIEAGLAAIGGRNTEAPLLSDAIQKYIDFADLSGSRSASIKNLKRFLGYFEDVQGSTAPLCDISPVHVSMAARDRYSNPESIRSYMAVVIAFFRWCAEAERQWVSGDWFRRIKLRSGRSEKERVTIAAPEQVAAFMKHTPEKYQPGFAIAWFAGVRPEELIPKDKKKDCLQWSDIKIDARTIEIRAAVSKIRRPRLIHNCFENLWSWLESVPLTDRTGAVIGINHRNFRKLRRSIADNAGIPTPWPRDLTRHSFSTYSFHHFGLETTINNTGHMDEPKTFFSHYKGSTVKTEAAEYARISKS